MTGAQRTLRLQLTPEDIGRARELLRSVILVGADTRDPGWIDLELQHHLLGDNTRSGMLTDLYAYAVAASTFIAAYVGGHGEDEVATVASFLAEPSPRE